MKADHVVAEGPVNSIQFHDPADSDLTGSSNLTFQNDVLSVGGGLTLNRRYTDSSITVSVTDYYVGVGTVSNPVVLTLPDAALMGNGQTYVVKDEGGAAHSNNITITAHGSQTIDNQNSIVWSHLMHRFSFIVTALINTLLDKNSSTLGHYLLPRVSLYAYTFVYTYG